MKGGVPIEKARSARVSMIACARGKAHIQDGFPGRNPAVERCSEFPIEEERGPFSVVVLNVEDDVPQLVHIISVNVWLDILSEHLAESAHGYRADGGVPELLNRIPPLMPRAGHRLHLVDPSREVNMKTG